MGGPPPVKNIAYVLGGLPFLVILAAYNSYYFGSPLIFGQTVASKIIALRDTGSENLWQSSLRESLPGLLISPSRGLVWFSPVLVLGLVSAVAVWKEPRYRPLIPLQASVVVMILVAGRWFDWWGGSTWGYRPIVDTTPFLALLMLPIVERLMANCFGRVLFGTLLVWSAGVQFVGAYSYSAVGWIDQWREYDNPDRASLRGWQWQRTADRLSCRQLRSGTCAERGVDRGIRRQPETDSHPAGPAGGIDSGRGGPASRQGTGRPGQAP